MEPIHVPDDTNPDGRRTMQALGLLRLIEQHEAHNPEPMTADLGVLADAWNRAGANTTPAEVGEALDVLISFERIEQLPDGAGLATPGRAVRLRNLRPQLHSFLLNLFGVDACNMVTIDMLQQIFLQTIGLIVGRNEMRYHLEQLEAAGVCSEVGDGWLIGEAVDIEAVKRSNLLGRELVLLAMSTGDADMQSSLAEITAERDALRERLGIAKCDVMALIETTGPSAPTVGTPTGV